MPNYLVYRKQIDTSETVSLVYIKSDLVFIVVTMAQGTPRSLEEVTALVQALSPYLKSGTSLKIACLVTKIPYTSILNYMEKYPDICTIIESNQLYLDTVAESNIAYKIVNDKDISTSKWWLERSQKEKYSSNSKEQDKPLLSETEHSKIDLSSFTNEELNEFERLTRKATPVSEKHLTREQAEKVYEIINGQKETTEKSV